MLSILVLYASHHGQTRAIAERIAAGLLVQGHEVDTVDVRCDPLPPPEDYDAVVLGSRVEMNRHARRIRNYVKAHRKALRAMPTAFFVDDFTRYIAASA